MRRRQGTGSIVVRRAGVLPMLGLAAVAAADTAPRLADYYSVISPKVIDAGYSTRWIDVPPFTADLNGDGKEDLVVLGVNFACCGAVPNATAPSRVFFGDGDGGFSLPSPSVFPMDTLQMVDPRKVLFGDLNADGRLDLFIACAGWDADPYPGEQNRLYLSQPGGGWKDATSALPPLSDYSHTAAMGDISGRGAMDIFVDNHFGGHNRVLPYALLNNGSGQFTMTRSILPVGPGQTLDSDSGRWFLGATLTDFDGDGLSELIVTGDSSNLAAPYQTLAPTTILWNRGGTFSEANKTELPAPSPFPTHFELDAQPIDLNGDGLRDLVIVGSQGQPFYDGWFVQLALNQGNRTFVDVTASRLATGDRFGGIPGIATGSPWPKWVQVLDYNGDGLPDFAVEYWPPDGSLPPSQPLVYLNDGVGHFSTLKVGDFVAPGNEWILGGAHLMPTRNGYSFVTPYQPLDKTTLNLTGLLAAKPYRAPSRLFNPLTPCRLVDTRAADGPALAGGATRTFLLAGRCGLPSTAKAVSVNVTVTQPTAPGDLRLHPGGTTVPLVSAINYSTGQTRANNAVLALGAEGHLAVQCDQAAATTTHFILDVNGYFE